MNTRFPLQSKARREPAVQRDFGGDFRAGVLIARSRSLSNLIVNTAASASEPLARGEASAAFSWAFPRVVVVYHRYGGKLFRVLDQGIVLGSESRATWKEVHSGAVCIRLRRKLRFSERGPS